MHGQRITLLGMISVADQTKYLIETTKKLLAERSPLSLREIAAGADVELEWLRKFTNTDLKKPAIDRVERVHEYLEAFKAAKRFGLRTEARAG